MSDCFDHALDAAMEILDGKDTDEPEDGYNHGWRYPGRITCKYCSATGLRWMMSGRRWALVETSDDLHNRGAFKAIHKCQNLPTAMTSAATCKFCRVGGLVWNRTGAKPVLSEKSGQPHKCKEGTLFYRERAQSRG